MPRPMPIQPTEVRSQLLCIVLRRLLVPPPSLLPDSCSFPRHWQVCAIIMQANLAEGETGRGRALVRSSPSPSHV